MKKTRLLAMAALAVSPFFFASCGSTTTDTASLTTFKGEGFSVDVPKSWIPVEAKELPTPKLGKVVLSLSSTEIASGFANNMLVLKAEGAPYDKDPVMTQSENYSRSSNLMAQKHYKEYEKADVRNATLIDGDKSQIYIFDAKYNDETPIKRFVQMGKICNDKDYYVINIVGDKEKADLYVNLAKTFQCAK